MGLVDLNLLIKFVPAFSFRRMSLCGRFEEAINAEYT